MENRHTEHMFKYTNSKPYKVHASIHKWVLLSPSFNPILSQISWQSSIA